MILCTQHFPNMPIDKPIWDEVFDNWNDLFIGNNNCSLFELNDYFIESYFDGTEVI